jgi:16S rRNA (guanine966-N2)-methyltransferase
LDPPFADSTFAKNLQFIKENKLYNRNHLIIIHREKKTIDEIEDFMKIIIVKKYGRSKIIFGSFI